MLRNCKNIFSFCSRTFGGNCIMVLCFIKIQSSFQKTLISIRPFVQQNVSYSIFVFSHKVICQLGAYCYDWNLFVIRRFYFANGKPFNNDKQSLWFCNRNLTKLHKMIFRKLFTQNKNVDVNMLIVHFCL